MTADKEAAVRLASLIDEEAGRSTGKRYSFDHFCREHNLYHSTDKVRNGEVFINCVFHRDEDPSLSFNEEKRVWHCLGCGAGGRYLDFVYRYETEILGDEISYYHFLERVLRNDHVLQERLGLQSIFKRAGITAESLGTVDRFVFRPAKWEPGNYLELADIMQRKHCSRQETLAVLLGMQEGLDVGLLYRQMTGEQTVSDYSGKYDLTDKEGGFL